MNILDWFYAKDGLAYWKQGKFKHKPARGYYGKGRRRVSVLAHTPDVFTIELGRLNWFLHYGVMLDRVYHKGDDDNYHIDNLSDTLPEVTQSFLRGFIELRDGMPFHAYGKKKGKHLGYLHKTTGGRYLRINYEKYHLSKLMYLYHYGYLPTKEEVVVHLDGDKQNFRKENLKLTNRSTGIIHRIDRDNMYGRGVGRSKDIYWSCIKVNGRRHYLGSHTNAEKAQKAYRKAAIHHYGELAKVE